jgi:hypothetical protein
MKENTTIESEVLEKIKKQINPNLRIQKHLRILKYFWMISCLFSGSFIYCLYTYPALMKLLENSYSFLIYLPTLLIIILIFLGCHFQEVKILDFKNQSKFKDF